MASWQKTVASLHEISLLVAFLRSPGQVCLTFHIKIFLALLTGCRINITAHALQLLLCAPEGWSRSEGLSSSLPSPLSAVYQPGSLPKASLTPGLSLLIKWQWNRTGDKILQQTYQRPYLGRDSGIAFYGFVVCFLQDRVLLDRLIWPGTSYVGKLALSLQCPCCSLLCAQAVEGPGALYSAALLFQ